MDWPCPKMIYYLLVLWKVYVKVLNVKLSYRHSEVKWRQSLLYIVIVKRYQKMRLVPAEQQVNTLSWFLEEGKPQQTW